jgi:hypothetical protein
MFIQLKDSYDCDSHWLYIKDSDLMNIPFSGVKYSRIILYPDTSKYLVYVDMGVLLITDYPNLHKKHIEIARDCIVYFPSIGRVVKLLQIYKCRGMFDNQLYSIYRVLNENDDEKH